jgi:hypothetical protein
MVGEEVAIRKMEDGIIVKWGPLQILLINFYDRGSPK